MKVSKPSSSLSRNEKKSSASFTSNSGIYRTRLQPLTRQFFSNLIRLETDFHNKDYTLETLDELTEYYANAVEYYDSIKDQVAVYFVFKIQEALATKQSLKMLIDQAFKSKNKNEEHITKSPINSTSSPNPQRIQKGSLTKTGSSLKDEIIHEDFDEESDNDGQERDAMKLERLRIANQKRKGRVSITKLKGKKQRTVAMFCKVEHEKRNAEQNLTKVLDVFTDYAKENDNLIKRDIEYQKLRIQQKLEQKKQASFATHPNGTSFNTANLSREAYPQKKEYSRIEYVLKELENSEDGQPSRGKSDDSSGYEEDMEISDFGNTENSNIITTDNDIKSPNYVENKKQDPFLALNIDADKENYSKTSGKKMLSSIENLVDQEKKPNKGLNTFKFILESAQNKEGVDSPNAKQTQQLASQKVLEPLNKEINH